MSIYVVKQSLSRNACAKRLFGLTFECDISVFFVLLFFTRFSVCRECYPYTQYFCRLFNFFIIIDKNTLSYIKLGQFCVGKCQMFLLHITSV